MVGLTIAAMLLQVQAPVATVAPNETLLQVQAEGRATGVPDVAEFSSGVTADGATAAAALAANSVIAGRLIEAASAAGLPPTAVRTEQLGVRPRFRPDKDGDDSDEIVGYRATNQLRFRLTNVTKAPMVIDALFKAGATDLNGPTFDFADKEPLERKARENAVAAAKTEAADYAAALNVGISRVLRVSERSAQVDGSGDIIVTGARRSSAPPVLPGEQQVTVTVWVDFALIK